MPDAEDIEVRLAIVETKLEGSFHEHELLFSKLENTNTKLDATNDKLASMIRRQDKSEVYTRILWPTVTALSSIIAFLLGNSHVL